MVRSKKEYICRNCARKYIKWRGICECGRADTLDTKILVPERNRPQPTQKSIGERAKRSERGIARSMTAADGPDPMFARIASSTGRVGHITALRFDAISRNYVIENKNRVLPTWLILAWKVINQRAIEYNKAALLHIEPPNMPKTILVNGKHEPLGTLSIITQDRHEELIGRDKTLSNIETIVTYRGKESAATILSLIEEELRGK